MCIHKKNKEINKALKLLKTVILDETISTIYKSSERGTFGFATMGGQDLKWKTQQGNELSSDESRSHEKRFRETLQNNRKITKIR